jgi:hypothetical protein
LVCCAVFPIAVQLHFRSCTDVSGDASRRSGDPGLHVFPLRLIPRSRFCVAPITSILAKNQHQWKHSLRPPNFILQLVRDIASKPDYQLVMRKTWNLPLDAGTER